MSLVVEFIPTKRWDASFCCQKRNDRVQPMTRAMFMVEKEEEKLAACLSEIRSTMKGSPSSTNRISNIEQTPDLRLIPNPFDSPSSGHLKQRLTNFHIFYEVRQTIFRREKKEKNQKYSTFVLFSTGRRKIFDERNSFDRTTRSNQSVSTPGECRSDRRAHFV